MKNRSISPVFVHDMAWANRYIVPATCFFTYKNDAGAPNKLQNWKRYNTVQYTIPGTLNLYLLHIHSTYCPLLLIYYLLLDTGKYGAIGLVRLFWIINVLITVARVVYCILYVWFLIRYKRWPRVQE
jgi:hypothetical protein